MRIMQVMAGAAVGGAEAAFEDLCLALSGHQDVELCAVLRDNNDERLGKLASAGIKIHTVPFGGIFDVYSSWKMKQLIRNFQPQIVQTWMSRASQKTPAAGKANSYLKFSRLGGYYSLKYYKTTDYFVANTPDILNYLVREGIDECHARHINNFTTAEQVTSPVNRSDLQTPKDAFVVLALARYHPVKALDILIRAAEKIENCHVWLAGMGPLEEDLKKLAADLKIENRIHFLGWRSDRAALLEAADVCAVPSRFEPFGNTFIQAWAQKTPLVSSKSEGPMQYIRDGEDALMFDIDDVAGLTECLEKLRTNPDLGHKLVQAGFSRFEQEFSKEKTLKAYLDYYQFAIDSLRAT
ncbi:MAG: hypothetical protein AUJ12_00610 [Alphaproteobacteria bacterium CG1_02_46_17]|nr:MAG: hypothetical protein AUJ12_00610 [Alphaproteobacteria bacterium CG1_02_46_17]